MSWEWMQENATLISAAMTGVTATIWVIYLNVFLSSYRRQHRPSILITAGAGKGLNSHCFVTNLGLEPVYLLDILLEVRTSDGKTLRAVVPERNERHREDDEMDARRATNLGPIQSGEETDIGRFRTLLTRAREDNADIHEDIDLECLTITVVTVTASRAALYGAQRQYVMSRDDNGDIRVRPTTIKAKQLDGPLARRNLSKLLAAELGTSRNT